MTIGVKEINIKNNKKKKKNKNDSEEVSLYSLKVGQHAIISRITGLRERVHQLEDFGFIKGREIIMVRPIKDMCIVKMCGGEICVRTGGEVNILVVNNNQSGE